MAPTRRRARRSVRYAARVRAPTIAARDRAYIAEQNAATRYTAAWHRVADWAREVLQPFAREITDISPRLSARVAGLRAQWVSDLRDDEEAEAKARVLEAIDFPAADRAPAGRGRGAGGRRRVIIRAHTWIRDLEAGVMYSPQWITTGEGMTARAAHAAHNRYIRDYTRAVERGVESRLLAVTAIEILWWTSAWTARYV